MQGEASPDAPLVEETLEPRSRHWSPRDRRSPQAGGGGLVLGSALPGQGEGTWANRPSPCLPWSSVSVPRVKGTSARRHPRQGEGTWAKRPSPPPLELRFFSVQNLSTQNQAFPKTATARKLLQSSVSHDPSEIILKCWIAAQDTFLILSMVKPFFFVQDPLMNRNFQRTSFI